MWESPIDVINKKLIETGKAFALEFDNEIMKVVWEAGFNVNKEELAKALAYDRDQYNKGYDEGYNEGWSKGYETAKEDVIVHAHWKGGIVTSLHCSNCGEIALRTYFEEEFMSNYCPHCGARMDEEVEE